MQTLPTGWAEARRNKVHRWETKVTVAGVEYSEANIYELSIRAALYSSGTVAIGGCVSKEIDLVIMPQGNIPRMAEIRVFTRPVADGVTPEWLQKGVFYIDTRETDKVTGIMTIHGYDAMLKAEQTFLTETTEDDWPKPMDEVVVEIAQRMGVTVDCRTVVNHTLEAGYPLEYTMREVLGYIASAHAGNWIMTDAGELRLVGVADIPAETYYLVTEDGDAILFGDTRILI